MLDTHNYFVKFLSKRTLWKNSYMSDKDLDLLQGIILARDANNNGMTRKEVFLIIQQLTGCSTMKKAKNVLDYYIREGRMEGLKRAGRVVTAQSTTTK